MKKLIIILSCAAVIAGGTFGGYKIHQKNKDKKTVAEVVPVSNMSEQYWGDTLEISGMISSGNVQNVKLDNQKLVEEVLVKEGDTVKKGDPLLKYDMTALELDVAQKENAAAVAEVNIKTANKELSKLKNLKPSEMMPTEPEPTEPPPPTEPPTDPPVDKQDFINDSAAASEGDGSQGNPLAFNCSESTMVSAVFLNTLMHNKTYANFVVYDDFDTPIYKRSIYGGDITEERTDDWAVSSDVTVGVDGSITLNNPVSIPGSFTVCGYESESQDAYEDDYEPYYEPKTFVPDPNSDDYMYSRAELDRMISDKESEISELEIAKKFADLEYKTALAQRDSGSILCTIDGIVSKVNEGEADADTPFIVVQGQNGLCVKGYIGEMNLDKVAVGNTVDIMSWETGETASAQVTEINKTPVSFSSQNWGENPNSSTYEFTAEVLGDTQMSADIGISITIPDNQEESGMYIPKVYVREEDGKHYVMKADENNKLKKQFVKTGKILYGYQIEIKGGLLESDKICFPYGKNIKEGVRTKDTDEVLW